MGAGNADPVHALEVSDHTMKNSNREIQWLSLHTGLMMRHILFFCIIHAIGCTTNAVFVFVHKLYPMYI